MGSAVKTLVSPWGKSGNPHLQGAVKAVNEEVALSIEKTRLIISKSDQRKLLEEYNTGSLFPLPVQ